MPAQRGLLKRLHQGEAKSEDWLTDPVSIVEHLQYLLNTRCGEAIISPQYGIEDLSDLRTAFPEAAEVWRISIQQAIEAYEPRLYRVRVKHVPSDDPMVVSFRISARLRYASRSQPLTLQTQVDQTGQFDVW